MEHPPLLLLMVVLLMVASESVPPARPLFRTRVLLTCLLGDLLFLDGQVGLRTWVRQFHT